jgi:putative restriction endonuclease
VLEAAHIIPYVSADSNLIQNGICLRADIHCLFDKNLIKIGPDYQIFINPKVDAYYWFFNGIFLVLPDDPAFWPDKYFLALRWLHYENWQASDWEQSRL